MIQLRTQISSYPYYFPSLYICIQCQRLNEGINMSFIISVVFCWMLSIKVGPSAVAMKLCLKLRHWWVITPHSKLREVIIYPCHNLRCFASMLSLRWTKIMNILRWLKTFLWNLHNATQCSVHSVNTMLSNTLCSAEYVVSGNNYSTIAWHVKHR